VAVLVRVQACDYGSGSVARVEEDADRGGGSGSARSERERFGGAGRVTADRGLDRLRAEQDHLGGGRAIGPFRGPVLSKDLLAA
jgi:hypothetical protein